jgi:serine/threonine-protein kinase
MPLSAGTKLGTYEVVSSIGVGGMGEVYKAWDPRLDRAVAIKILRVSLADRPDTRARFDREARALASLNHPHICALYDIGHERDIDYLVMEFVEGETLAQRIAKGPLLLDLVLKYAIQISDALDRAHGKEVIHRDIKPNNIMITPEDGTKLLDFGVAKLLSGQPASGEIPVYSCDLPTVPGDGVNTQLGALVGTVVYMSPEQARGGKIDARSDIFSFGLVLYQMATGQHPFQKETPAATLGALLYENCPPMKEKAAGVPHNFEAIVARCLQKEAVHRYQRMADVRTAIEELQSGKKTSTPEAVPSIAVLPFTDMSAGAENDYFSDGLTEELINALAQLKGLRIVSRSSAFQFKGKNQDSREVGEKLGVTAIVDGSVRRAGNRCRITAELVSVSDGYQLWSERFDRELEDIFEVQEDVARAIVAKLIPRLAVPAEPLVKAYTENFAAHELYLKGRYLLNRQTPDSLWKALADFEQALQLSPDYALARVGVADCCLLLGWYGTVPPSEVMPKAKQAALRALETDDTLALAHCALALVHAGYEWNWTEAGREFKRALELGAGFAAPHFHYALDYLTPLGRLDEAIQEIQSAQLLDPLSLITAVALGGCFHRKGRYDAAVERFRAILERAPTFYHAHWSLARTLEQQGKFDQAVEAFQKANELSGCENPLILGELGHCWGAMSRCEEANQLLRELEEMSPRKHVSSLSFALVHLGIGEKDLALEFLEKAYQQRARALVWINLDPRFDSLRSDPRFSNLLNRIGISAAAA